MLFYSRNSIFFRPKRIRIYLSKCCKVIFVTFKQVIASLNDLVKYNACNYKKVNLNLTHENNFS